MESAAGEQDYPQLSLFRVTVIGSAECGKTSLINVFTNSHCPTVYQQTDDPTLYYKTLGLPPRKQGQEPFPALVEIEDTYAAERQDGEDRYGRLRDISPFLSVFDDDDKRPELSKREADATEIARQVFSDAPIPHIDKYMPISRNRMAFLIVFDATNEASFAEAKKAHQTLELTIQLHKVHFRPVVYLVANKVDKGNKMLAAARDYAELYKGKLKPVVEISALEVRKVKKLFRDMLVDVRENPILWRLNWQEDDGDHFTPRNASGSMGAGLGLSAEKCTVQ